MTHSSTLPCNQVKGGTVGFAYGAHNAPGSPLGLDCVCLLSALSAISELKLVPEKAE